MKVLPELSCILCLILPCHHMGSSARFPNERHNFFTVISRLCKTCFSDSSFLRSPCPHRTPNFSVFMVIIDFVSRPQFGWVISYLQKGLLILELVTFGN